MSNTEKLEQYVRADLRRRFDAADDFEAISIIDETRYNFGFTDLAKEMITELCSDDESASLWKMHEHGIKTEERGEQLFELNHGILIFH